MTHDWLIRRADVQDAEGLKDAITAAYAIYAGHIEDLPDVADGIEQDIAENLVCVAEKDGLIGGGMVLVPGAGFLQIANIAVAPAFGGQGLGRLLMARAEDEARQGGYSEMRLSTHVLMPDNVALYAHLGWRETGRSGSKVFMTKTLATN